MQAPATIAARRHATPTWVGWVLVAGSVLLVAWAWFVSGFLAEPSAVGRSRLVLDLAVGGGLGGAAVGLVSAFGLLTRRRWSWAAGVFASVIMVLTVAGAIAGIPALIGLWSSRKLS